MAGAHSNDNTMLRIDEMLHRRHAMPQEYSKQPAGTERFIVFFVTKTVKQLKRQSM
jgi:hypothetical protein